LASAVMSAHHCAAGFDKESADAVAADSISITAISVSFERTVITYSSGTGRSRIIQCNAAFRLRTLLPKWALFRPIWVFLPIRSGLLPGKILPARNTRSSIENQTRYLRNTGSQPDETSLYTIVS